MQFGALYIIHSAVCTQQWEQNNASLKRTPSYYSQRTEAAITTCKSINQYMNTVMAKYGGICLQPMQGKVRLTTKKRPDAIWLTPDALTKEQHQEILTWIQKILASFGAPEPAHVFSALTQPYFKADQLNGLYLTKQRNGHQVCSPYDWEDLTQLSAGVYDFVNQLKKAWAQLNTPVTNPNPL